MSDAKWKDLLLKSSLPLEHVVAATLARLQWYVEGQYTYARTNEAGLSTDFSVDLHACKHYSSKTHSLARLDLLVECKYASPGVRWLFLPYPATTLIDSGCGMIKVIDKGTNKKAKDRRPLDAAESDLEYCIRGIALHEGGCDEQAIMRGAAQLRYAMPHLCTARMSDSVIDWCDEDIAVKFACAILVTTAPIYCLKHGLSLEQVYAAKELEDVADRRDSVLLWEQSSPDLTKYARHLYGQMASPEFVQRIEHYAAVFQPTPASASPPCPEDAARAICDSGGHVLVISLHRLESVLESLCRAIAQTAGGIEKIAEVNYDPRSGEVAISPRKPSRRTAWGPIRVHV